MLFNDYPFLLVFLPAAILLYRLVDPYPQLRIVTLVLLSFAFYAYGNPPFILLLVLSILVNWLAALAYARTKRKAILTAAIVADLAVLTASTLVAVLRNLPDTRIVIRKGRVVAGMESSWWASDR